MARSLIEQIHSYVRRSIRTRGHVSEAAKTKVPGKTYPRMPQIKFPPLTPLDITLSDALNKRQSQRDTSLSNPLTREELGTLLGHSLGAKPDGHRRYPSGGTLHPLEAYIIVNKVEGLKRSIYHYDPDEHALEELWPVPHDLQIPELMFGFKFTAFSSCIIVFTCVWDRSRKKYADFAYLLSLIESGAAGQNVGLVAAALDISACPVAGFEEDQMHPLLDVRDGEQAIYTIALGKPARI